MPCEDVAAAQAGEPDFHQLEPIGGWLRRLDGLTASVKAVSNGVEAHRRQRIGKDGGRLFIGAHVAGAASG